MNIDLRALVGFKLHSVLIDEDSKYIVFNVQRNKSAAIETKEIMYQAIGDCCSCSWMEDITGVASAIGHEIITTDAKESKTDHDESDEGEVWQYFAYVIKTTGGTIEIEFRNISNGYYSGNLEEVDDIQKIDATFNAITTDHYNQARKEKS